MPIRSFKVLLFLIVVYGDLVSQDPNPAVPVTLLAEIVVCQSVNMSWQEILKHIRARTVPNGYRYHNWKPGAAYFALLPQYIMRFRC